MRAPWLLGRGVGTVPTSFAVLVCPGRRVADTSPASLCGACWRPQVCAGDRQDDDDARALLATITALVRGLPCAAVSFASMVRRPTERPAADLCRRAVSHHHDQRWNDVELVLGRLGLLPNVSTDREQVVAACVLLGFSAEAWALSPPPSRCSFVLAAGWPTVDVSVRVHILSPAADDTPPSLQALMTALLLDGEASSTQKCRFKVCCMRTVGCSDQPTNQRRVAHVDRHFMAVPQFNLRGQSRPD